MLHLQSNINIKSILTSGQCFRHILEEDGSITNILEDRIINIKQVDNDIYITSSNYDNLENIIKDYFDLNRDYNLIHKELLKNNKDLKNIINKCLDYRVLNQSSFEMCISYIISQNNNVKRISKSINLLCERYGKEIIFNNKKYYLFPKYEDIKDITIEELRSLGIGFRDKYIRSFLDNYSKLLDLDKLDTDSATSKLMSVHGIGLKVASCILLFGYKRLDTFPIDTWVKKYISSKYNIKNNMNDIMKYAKDKYGKYSGLVLQYMFHSERNLNQ